MTPEKANRRSFLKGLVGSGLMAPFVSVPAIHPLRAQKLETLNVGASPFINQAAIFLANERGWFAKVGLQLNVKSFPDGSLIVAPLLSGEIDLGVVTSSAGLFNALSRGAPFRSLLCIGQGRKGRAVTAILVRKDHYDNGIRTIKDLGRLKGRTVAVGAAGSINQYGMSKALELAGLNPVRDVIWQTTVGQPDIVKQLGQKQIDAADITYHLAYLAQQQGFAQIIASRDEFLPDSQTAMIAARNEILRSRRDALVRFAMVHIHAARLFNTIAGNPAQHPTELQTITKYIFVKDTNILKAVAPHWEWIAEDGMPNATSVMAQQDHWADTFKLVERKVPQDQVFDLGIAREAARRLAAEKPFGP